jgi:hypothetical protein
MSALTRYLTVALATVSLAACHSYRTPPRQLATPRPEEVLLQRDRPLMASDTIGTGLIDKHVVVRSTVGTTLGTAGTCLMGPKWKEFKLYYHQRKLRHEGDVCAHCPILITKRR